jgi:hypothetical protein
MPPYYQNTAEVYRADYSENEMKEMQEREAERALERANATAVVMTFVRSLPQEIAPIGNKLAADLETLADAMDKYADTTLTSDLDEGLTGKSGNAVKKFLTDMKRPDLRSPVQNA